LSVAPLARVLARHLWLVLLAVGTACAESDGFLVAHYDGARLSLHGRAVTLTQVLARIAQDTCLRFEVAAEIAQAPARWDVADLPLAAALIELTRPYDTALYLDRGARTCLHLAVLPRAEPAALDGHGGPTAHHPDDEALRLAAVVRNERDAAIRRQAIGELAGLDRLSAVRGLEAALAVDVPELRSEIVRALGRRYDTAPPIALGQVLLGDKDNQVRLTAVQTLAQMNTDVARVFLRQALDDRDAQVRRQAEASLAAAAVTAPAADPLPVAVAAPAGSAGPP
jgi:hypothetical protein